MSLLVPDIDLFLWTLLSLANLLLLIWALLRLNRSKTTTTGLKLRWLIVIILLPVIGSLLCLRYVKK